MGRSETEIELDEGATVAGLMRKLEEAFPQVAPYSSYVMVAVNAEYVEQSQPLCDGDEVAFIPPVSGGQSIKAMEGQELPEPVEGKEPSPLSPSFLSTSSRNDDPLPEPVEGNGGKGRMLFKVTDEPLDPRALEEATMDEANGALVTFCGVARRYSRGKRVQYLEYDAYQPMAEKKLREIGQEIAQKWPIGAIAIHHRIGRLEIGETSLVVVVASPHRQEAFEACRYAVDRIKTVVPIWKKEVWEDGESWVEGEALATKKPLPH